MNKLRGVQVLEEAFLFRMNINSLYIKMAMPLEFQAVQKAFLKYPDVYRRERQI